MWKFCRETHPRMIIMHDLVNKALCGVAPPPPGGLLGGLFGVEVSWPCFDSAESAVLSQQCWQPPPYSWRIIGRIIWGCRGGCTGASQSPASYKGTPQCIPFCHSWTLDSTTSKVGQGINSLLSMATPCVNPMRHPCFLVESVSDLTSMKVTKIVCIFGVPLKRF